MDEMQTAELRLPASAFEASAPPLDAARFAYDIDLLGDLRRFIVRHGVAAGLAKSRVSDLVIAAAELGANSVVHGGGSGEALAWREPDAILLETRDAGVITDPDVGKVQPPPSQDHGRGLWIVNQVCESVQIRSSSRGTAVRLRFELG